MKAKIKITKRHQKTQSLNKTNESHTKRWNNQNLISTKPQTETHIPKNSISTKSIQFITQLNQIRSSILIFTKMQTLHNAHFLLKQRLLNIHKG